MVLGQLQLGELAFALPIKLLEPLLPGEVLFEMAAQFVNLLLHTVKLRLLALALVLVTLRLEHVYHVSLRGSGQWSVVSGQWSVVGSIKYRLPTSLVALRLRRRPSRL